MPYSNAGDNVSRPFSPAVGEQDPAQRIAHALEYMASAMARMDRNLEVLVHTVKSMESTVRLR
jgi:hypothetical protein